MEDAQVLGVIERTGKGPRLSYVSGRAELTPDLLEAAKPAAPLDVLRVAARCEASRCAHFDGSACTLAERIVNALPEVSEALPPCPIRRSCRWFAEQGEAACRRCPQVVTRSERRSTDPVLFEGAGRTAIQ